MWHNLKRNCFTGLVLETTVNLLYGHRFFPETGSKIAEPHLHVRINSQISDGLGFFVTEREDVTS